ncbi:MAG: pilus assembly protein TadG-related protein [Candidatus Aquicultor sp.]
MPDNVTQRQENENGAVAVIVAILMIVFLGFTALVVDVGYLYEIRHQLQSAADAAALAGCQEMIMQAKDPNVVSLSEAVARDYALNKNLASEATPTVNLNEQSVTVTTGRTVDLFFAKIFNIFSPGKYNNGFVRAIAKAEVAYLVGVKDLDPMGVPNPKPKEVYVNVVDLSSGVTVYRNKLGGGNFVNDIFEYSGTIPSLADGKYRVDISRVNNQGFEEFLQGASALVVGSNGALGEVNVDENFVKANVATAIAITAHVSGSPSKVEAYWPKPNGNGSYSVALSDQGSGVYKATTTVNLPASDSGYMAYPITIKIDDTTVLPSGGSGAYIVARDPSEEITDVDLGVNYVSTGSSVSVNVKIQGFEYEKLYTLFLDNGTSPGNYYGLDLDYKEFGSGTGLPDSPTGGQGNGSGGDAFRDAIAGELHADPYASSHPTHYYEIGDYVWTKTGAMVGPLGQGISTRIGSDSCTWDMWKSNTTPHESRNQCPRLITVPLVEETTYEAINGRSKVAIVGFAQFFIENPPNGGELQGRFMEYVKGGIYQTEPPPEPNIKMVRLVKPDSEN